MKMKIFISLMLFMSSVCIAQQNTFNKEAELQKFVEMGGNIEETSSNIYKLTYPYGMTRTFNLNTKKNVTESNEGIDTTIINVWEIDTTEFNGMFTFWQQVQIANWPWLPLLIEDLNNNNQPELYGYSDISIFGDPGPIKIIERNLNGIYQNIFTYDSSTAFVKGIADINGNGDKEICIMSVEVEDSIVITYSFYKSDSSGLLPTTFDFNFYYNYNHQINEMIFGDWDNNGVTDCAFIVGAGWQRCIISEYRDSVNNFGELFLFVTTGEGDFSGFAIDDFDQDSKTELVISSGQGNVFVIENEGENEYALVNQFSFPSSNAYMQTETRDIDGNGKPEFWIAGQNFSDGITRIQCYETNRDNSYQVVAYLELRYLVSLNTDYLQAVDIDDDAKEELVFSIGNALLMLKFVGNVNEHIYKVFYAKISDTTWPGGAYPVSIADLDGDDKKDLLIPFFLGHTFPLSFILRQAKPSGIMSTLTNEIPEEFIYSYPNPFNSVSTISFNIHEASNVQLKIFDTLGKEINLLLDKELTPGKYEITWDATDRYGNSVPSGVYFISKHTGNFNKTIKTVLLK